MVQLNHFIGNALNPRVEEGHMNMSQEIFLVSTTNLLLTFWTINNLRPQQGQDPLMD